MEKVNASLERSNETLTEAKEELKKENKALGKYICVHAVARVHICARVCKYEST